MQSAWTARMVILFATAGSVRPQDVAPQQLPAGCQGSLRFLLRLGLWDGNPVDVPV
jgi:hypothetical protein